ncbi:hypothetical protein GCM10011415_34380 [Salipiger pallidus]|uniref:Response regulator receiver domain-containing protein n=1 Tax=Salipiger pallidus TaxID=1775170 RepID=A0A8J3EIK5_9RHOB|nr:hypothetical protein [Salipiger pallidus]GGG81878.1 hypothetical protein GCM10011415_34380 [Salipiger pallidus]
MANLLKALAHLALVLTARSRNRGATFPAAEREQLQHIFDAASAATCVLDDSDELILANRRTTARALLQGGGFDVALSDIRMPGGRNGIPFADEISTAMPRTAVLLMTGFNGQTQTRIGHFVLSKPLLRILGNAVVLAVRTKKG